MPPVDRYANPPVSLVVCEARHPVRHLEPKQVEDLRRAFREPTPVPRHDSALVINPATGEQRRVERFRFVSRDRVLAINVLQDRFSIETTSYTTWRDLRRVIQVAAEALSAIAPPPGIDRLGLRYIDEIRVPGDPSPQWHHWVAESLLGPGSMLASTGLRQTVQQGLAVLTRPNEQDSLTIRYGGMDGEPAVQSDDALVRPEQPASGPYFLLDFDGAWEADSTERFPEFDAADILSVADRLHEPIRAVFEALVTNRLRQEVLT